MTRRGEDRMRFFAPGMGRYNSRANRLSRTDQTGEPRGGLRMANIRLD
jgi:hypothetical protein